MRKEVSHMNAKKIWDSYKFPLLLLGGIFTGAMLGIIWST